MLRHMMSETMRDATRQIMPRQSIATVGDHRPASNSGRWTHGDGQARRLRRRRRMERSGPSHIQGWTVRTW
jgi:hypothetical protein